MKAIKFVILAAGVLGVIAFFLPYGSVKVLDQTKSFTGLDIMGDVELAEQQVKQARDALATSATERSDDADRLLKEAED